MAKIGIPRKSRKENNKNVLKTRSPNNSRGNRYSNNSRGNRYSNGLRGSRYSKNSRGNRHSNHSRGLSYPNNSRSSGNSLSSIWSKNQGPRKPRSRKQIIVMAIILIAFICGLALGISMILGIGESDSGSGHVQYMNVTKNITVYENSSYDLRDENGTQISYYDFDENVSEGQNITAFNASNSANIY